MTNDTSAKIIEAGLDFLGEHRRLYLQSGGAGGHIMDLSRVGGYPFTTNCLIRYTGRKSGKIMIAPLVYGSIGGEVVIAASKGGADEHPAWYLNLRDRSEVAFQIVTQAFHASWREPAGDEYDRIWEFMVAVFPSYATCKLSTKRRIPLVIMKAIEAIEVFKESDMT